MNRRMRRAMGRSFAMYGDIAPIPDRWIYLLNKWNERYQMFAAGY